VEQVQTASLRLADAVQERIARLWALQEAGEMPLGEFRARAAALIAQTNAAGVQLADIGLAAEVTRQLRRPAAPIGLAPSPVQTDQRRILADIDRILDETPLTVSPGDLPESRSTRLGAWARTEPLVTVATAVQAGMQRRGAQGWVRQVDADPCRKCSEWADGVVRHPSTPMARHNGCGCIQVPVFTT
jgi:hypothetical protein